MYVYHMAGRIHVVLLVSFLFELIQKLTSIQPAGGKAGVDTINLGTPTVKNLQAGRWRPKLD